MQPNHRLAEHYFDETAAEDCGLLHLMLLNLVNAGHLNSQ